MRLHVLFQPWPTTYNSQMLPDDPKLFENPQPIMPLLMSIRKQKMNIQLPGGLTGYVYEGKDDSRRAVIDDLVADYFYGRRTCLDVAAEARQRLSQMT